MFSFPFDRMLQRLQPLVLHEDGLYICGRRADGPGALVTALGVVHPLRRLGTEAVLQAHARRLNRAAVETFLGAQMKRLLIDGSDPLWYFVEYLGPAFQRRDWSEQFDTDQVAPPPQAPVLLAEEAARAAQALALPDVARPALWLYGRAWELAPRLAQPGRLHVRLGRQTLGLTGQQTALGVVAEAWSRQLSERLTQLATELARRLTPVACSPAVAAARETVQQRGSFEIGDLVYLAGDPPRLGHIVPPHHNATLGRPVRRDLAMAAPLRPPFALAGLAVYVRSGERWLPASLPHGICLGSDPPADRPETPGLALAAYLRWAACRIATNGAFHSRDGEAPEETHDYY